MHTCFSHVQLYSTVRQRHHLCRRWQQALQPAAARQTSDMAVAWQAARANDNIMPRHTNKRAQQHPEFKMQVCSAVRRASFPTIPRGACKWRACCCVATQHSKANQTFWMLHIGNIARLRTK
jgi:hypothetical protein